MSFYATIGVRGNFALSRNPKVPLALGGGCAGGRSGRREIYRLPGGSEPGGGVFVGGASGRKGDAVRGRGARWGRMAVGRNLMWTGDPVFPFLLRYIIAGTGKRLHAGVLPCGYGGQRTPRNSGSLRRFRYSRRSIQRIWILAIPRAAGAGVCATADLDRAEHTVVAGGAGDLGWKRDAHRVQDGHDAVLLPVLPIALAAAAAGVTQLKVRRWLGSHYVVRRVFAASYCSELRDCVVRAGLRWPRDWFHLARAILARACAWSMRRRSL